MKKIDWKILIVTSLLCLVPIVIGLRYYEALPESVAIHFDINNNPDNYWPKNAFVFGLPLMIVAIQILTSVIVDLNDKRKDANKKMTLVSKLLLPIMSFVLYLATLGYALGNSLDIRKIAMCIIGIMFIVMGNYLPKTKGASFVKGLKVEDEELQNRLNKIAGYMFLIDGILAIISIFFKPIFSIMVILLVMLESLVLEIWVCKKIKEKGDIPLKTKIRLILITLVSIAITILCIFIFKGIV